MRWMWSAALGCFTHTHTLDVIMGVGGSSSTHTLDDEVDSAASVSSWI
jgi:hypothetical protein